MKFINMRVAYISADVTSFQERQHREYSAPFMKLLFFHIAFAAYLFFRFVLSVFI